MKKKISLLMMLVLCSVTSILVFGEIISFSGSNSNTQINEVTLLPYTPEFGTNLTAIRVNCTDFENDQIIWVNFTLENPTGHKYIDSENGTSFNDYWNSTAFQINETGTWIWNVTSNDNVTINTSLPYTSGTFTITDDLDWTPNTLDATRNISTDAVYNIEFWTDSREDLNFTLHHNIDGNFTVTLNVSHLVINSSRDMSFLNLNISPNTSSSYGNHSYNLTIKRTAPLNRTWNIPIEIEITTNFGDIEFISPSDYIITTICPGTWEHSLPVINLGNYDMTACHPYLYDTNGTQISTSANFNLAGGASGSAEISYVFTDDIITHFGVYCTASANGSLDYTTNDPQITLIEGEGCGEAGGGPGGGGAAPPRPFVEAVEKEVLPPPPRYCGDGICDEDLGETPWSCRRDCLGLVLKLENIFCLPLFRCGSWESAWFINFIILIVLGYIVYFMVLKKPKRL